MAVSDKGFCITAQLYWVCLQGYLFMSMYAMRGHNTLLLLRTLQSWLFSISMKPESTSSQAGEVTQLAEFSWWFFPQSCLNLWITSTSFSVQEGSHLCLRASVSFLDSFIFMSGSSLWFLCWPIADPVHY